MRPDRARFVTRDPGAKSKLAISKCLPVLDSFLEHLVDEAVARIDLPAVRFT